MNVDASGMPIAASSPLDTIRILLVEDDDGCALLMNTILTRWRFDGFTIRRAVSLEAAVNEVSKGGLDVILLDLGLPDSYGFTTFQRMRTAAAGLPIIVLSGLDDESLAIKAISQGAQDYIVKGGTDGSALARMIRFGVERCRAQQAFSAEHDLLRSVNATLEQRVNERTGELRKAMARLESEDRARDEIVSRVSHELRSPLTTMMLAIGNLLEGRAGPVSASVRDYILMLDMDCRRMADTVEELVDSWRASGCS